MRLGVAEAIASGVTTVHDWAHNVRSPADADADLQALADSGIRARFSYGTPHGLDPDLPMDRADLARVQREWIGARTEGLFTLGMASRGRPELTRLHTARPDVLRADWDHARSLGLPITIHASQAGAAALLGGEGWLGPDVQFVHGVYATEQDVAILAETGAHMSISPVSDLRIVLGFAPVSDMLAAGFPLSLSFDASSIAGNADMFATMRVAVCAEHARTRDAMTLPPRRALELATIDGARDLGLADRVGSLTPGKRADLILVRTSDLNMAPFVDPYIALVHCAQPANVDTVWSTGASSSAGASSRRQTRPRWCGTRRTRSPGCAPASAPPDRHGPGARRGARLPGRGTTQPFAAGC